MGRKPLERDPILPYHVFARSNNKEWFYIPSDQAWTIFCFQLRKVIELYNVRIHAFVLMSNHFHLLISTPNANLGDAMRYLLREVSKSINRPTGRRNHVFGGPYKWSLIRSRFHFKHAFKYLYRNPVEAGMCARVEEYPFSTLQFELGRSAPLFNLSEAKFEKRGDWGKIIPWLNHAYSPEEKDCVRRALRRREMEFCPDRQTNKLPKLFTALD